jgi:hypothetical protein
VALAESQKSAIGATSSTARHSFCRRWGAVRRSSRSPAYCSSRLRGDDANRAMEPSSRRRKPMGGDSATTRAPRAAVAVTRGLALGSRAARQAFILRRGPRPEPRGIQRDDAAWRRARGRSAALRGRLRCAAPNRKGRNCLRDAPPHLEIEQADRRCRETERRHGREPRRLHDAAKGHPDRSFHLIQRRDRIAIRCRGNLHDHLSLGCCRHAADACTRGRETPIGPQAFAITS